MADYIYMMETRLSPEQQRGVALVQDAARAHEMNVYLAGGAVRDMISGFSIRDLDFVIQGNALRITRDLEKAGATLQAQDEELKLMYVLLPGNVRAEIAMARAEKYDKPGRAPEVSAATIAEDLRRRDFTINAMALSLNPGSRGLLLDPFNGVADVEAKLIRIVHNYAFLEEPSRLIRATRFAARFHWAMEDRTQARYNSAVENRYIDNITDDARGYEIEQIAYEDDPLHIMKVLEREGWLRALFSRWSVAKVDTSGLSQLLKLRAHMAELGYTTDPSAAVMDFLTGRMSGDDRKELQKLILNKGFVQQWRALEEEARELAKRLTSKEAGTPSLAWKLLLASRPETILFLEVSTRQQAVTQKLRNFFGKWRQVKQKLPLPEFADLRITPDLPEYPQLAEHVFYMLLDGRSRSEIMKYVKPFSPPPPPPPPPPPVKRGRAKAAEAAPAAPVAAAGLKGKRDKKKQPTAPQNVATKVAKAVGTAAGMAMGAAEKAKAALAGIAGKRAASKPATVRPPRPAAKKRPAAKRKPSVRKSAVKKASKKRR